MAVARSKPRPRAFCTRSGPVHRSGGLFGILTRLLQQRASPAYCSPTIGLEAFGRIYVGAALWRTPRLRPHDLPALPERRPSAREAQLRSHGEQLAGSNHHFGVPFACGMGYSLRLTKYFSKASLFSAQIDSWICPRSTRCQRTVPDQG